MDDPGLLLVLKRELKLSRAVKAVLEAVNLLVLKKFLISVTKIHIVNFLKFLGTIHLILSASKVA